MHRNTYAHWFYWLFQPHGLPKPTQIHHSFGQPAPSIHLLNVQQFYLQGKIGVRTPQQSGSGIF